VKGENMVQTAKNNKLKKGEIITLGSTCSDEFFGLNVTKALQVFNGFVETISSEIADEDGFPKMSKSFGESRDTVINASLRVFSKSNSYTKGDYYNNIDGTPDMVKGVLNNDDYQKEFPANTTNYTVDSVNALLKKYYATLDPLTSNFNSNVVNTLFSNGQDRNFIPYKVIGVMVWAIFNALNKEAKATTAPKEKKVNAHIGNVGEKITVFKATVKSFRDMGSFSYNGPTSYLITFDSPQGTVKTFSTNYALTELNVGDTVNLEGKVKKHEEWKGYKSTMLNYTKIAPTTEEKKEIEDAKAKAKEDSKEKAKVRKQITTAFKLPSGKDLPELPTELQYVRSIDNPNFSPRPSEDTITNEFKSEYNGIKLKLTKRSDRYYYMSIDGADEGTKGLAFNGSGERNYLNFKKNVIHVLARAMGYPTEVIAMF
jgi:hypothetical protein